MENKKGKSTHAPLQNGKQETIAELAERHMHNQDHTTTDEEMRNAKVEVDATVPDIEGDLHEVDDTTVIPPLPGEPDDSGVGNGADNDDDDNSAPPNPYTVLGS